MAAVPVGYEAFHSLRRRGVTLLCFLLASTMAMGITVYVDSYSVHEWDKNLDVGDVALQVSGYNVGNYVDEIRAMTGVTKAETLQNGNGQLWREGNESVGIQEIYAYGNFINPSDSLLAAFPNYIQLVRGRMPENDSEIAAIYSLNTFYDLELSDVVTLEFGDSSSNVTVVGFYRHGGEGDSPYYWQYNSIAIVASGFLTPSYSDVSILVDVDRSVLTAFNPAGSLSHMNDIDSAIRALDPNYDPVYRPYSDIYVQDYLASGISAYISWVQGTRIAEMLRASSVLLLVILVTFLAIRYNVNERRYEESILTSRGASKGDLDKIVTREVFELSVVSALVGILLGILFSRIAISATGYFSFSISLLWTEPFLVSLDSLAIAAIVGLALPMLTLGGYRAVYSTKKNVDEERGRIAKLAKGLNLIRWDVFIVAIAGLLLLALSTGGSAVTNNPLLSIILPVLPLPLFLGVASLSMKALRRGANWISRIMKRVVGQIPSSIGIRRVGKEASSAGAAAMVLVLAICLSWNCAIIDASLPVTAQNQARLAVGADLTFKLNEQNYDSWDSLITNVTSNQLAESATLVSQKRLYLTADYGGGVEFMAVNPDEYSSIGYDYLGQRLNNSEISDLINQLQTTPDGAIITSDIADTYKLAVGDILRASTLDEGAFPVVFRILGITEALPEMPTTTDWWYYDYYPLPTIIPYPYYYGNEIGLSRVIVNRVYLGTLFNLINDTDNFLCIETVKNANATKIVEDVLDTGGLMAIETDGSDSVYARVHEYLDGADYRMERSIDTMLTILTIGSIFGAFSIYAVEGIRARRREIALLRSTGASKNTIILAQGAEMLILVLFSLFLLLLYSPLFLGTSLASVGGSTSGMFDIYPIGVFPVIPWNTIFIVLGFFLATVSIFIVVIAALSSKIKLSEALNAAWAEAGPYGGDV
jgi:ABC-type antimicrobial peptide transport system permease subunit